MKAPKCSICTKPCDPVADRNSDGTHSHDECLRAYALRPIAKGERGGNLYQSGKK